MATSCPITRQQFRDHAQDVELTINGKEMSAPVKEFSTGSLGWYLNEKIQLLVGDKKVTVQVGVNLTIIGSKALPRDPVREQPRADEHAAGHDTGDDDRTDARSLDRDAPDEEDAAGA